MNRFNLRYLLVWLVGLLASQLPANNIQISNTRLIGQNTTSGVNHQDNYTLVQFDCTLENSWRKTPAPNNWDAAWVFVKASIYI